MNAETILIIDDDQTIVHLIQANLEKHGYKNLTASNGSDGIKMAQQYKPDGIILDWMMPGMNGNEVLKILKNDQELKSIPVIMLTGQSEINNVSESLQLGAKDYIVKPFDQENFIIRLKNILR